MTDIGSNMTHHEHALELADKRSLARARQRSFWPVFWPAPMHTPRIERFRKTA